MSKKAAEFEEIVSEARESFDLGEFLLGRSTRTRTIRVFTDEVLAEERGGYETYKETLPNGFEVPRVRSWGLVAQLAQVQEDLEKESAKTTKKARELKAKEKALTAEIEALTAQLVESSLVIELRSIPKVIKKDAYRAAKKAQGIRGKIPDEQLVDFLEEQNAQMLVRTVVTITRESDKAVNQGISIEAARALIGRLPDSEWDRIEEKLQELLIRKAISDQVVADADF